MPKHSTRNLIFSIIKKVLQTTIQLKFESLFFNKMSEINAKDIYDYNDVAGKIVWAATLSVKQDKSPLLRKVYTIINLVSSGVSGELKILSKSLRSRRLKSLVVSIKSFISIINLTITLLFTG